LHGNSERRPPLGRARIRVLGNGFGGEEEPVGGFELSRGLTADRIYSLYFFIIVVDFLLYLIIYFINFLKNYYIFYY
jgi:hypothetical protein